MRRVPRFTVRVRLLAIFLLIGVVPLAVLGMVAYTRAVALVGADPATAAYIVDGLQLTILFLLGVGVAAAVGLSVLAANSVAAPLKDVEAAMAEVERGRLDGRAPVVSTDEIGAVAEGFNRMLHGLRERERVTETFGKYVTPEIRDEILAGRIQRRGRAGRGHPALRGPARLHPVGGGHRAPPGGARPQCVLHRDGPGDPRPRRPRAPVHRR